MKQPRIIIGSRLSSSVFLLVFALGFGLNAHAASIRVSQESSAGAGDFDANVLGTIDPFITALTTAGFYQYNNPNGASYNGELNGGPNPVSSTTQVFFVDASDGLSLVVVHDNPNDGTGGNTSTQWNLSNDTAGFAAIDGESGDTFTVSAGGTQFDISNNWLDCCTDGYAIGALENNWELLGQFLTTPTGIDSWAVIGNDFSSTSLVLDPGRRVRFDLVADVPVPAPLALLGLGLVGVAYQRCKQIKAA